MLVIAKAYGNNPVARIVTGCNRRVIYLRNPDCLGGEEPKPMSGVGFPAWAVFGLRLGTPSVPASGVGKRRRSGTFGPMGSG